MARRTHAQVAADAVAAERAAIAAYAESRCEQIEQMIGRRRITAAEGSVLQRRLRAFAGDIAAGLHVAGEGK